MLDLSKLSTDELAKALQAECAAVKAGRITGFGIVKDLEEKIRGAFAVYAKADSDQRAYSLLKEALRHVLGVQRAYLLNKAAKPESIDRIKPSPGENWESMPIRDDRRKRSLVGWFEWCADHAEMKDEKVKDPLRDDIAMALSIFQKVMRDETNMRFESEIDIIPVAEGYNRAYAMFQKVDDALVARAQDTRRREEEVLRQQQQLEEEARRTERQRLQQEEEAREKAAADEKRRRATEQLKAKQKAREAAINVDALF